MKDLQEKGVKMKTIATVADASIVEEIKQEQGTPSDEQINP